MGLLRGDPNAPKRVPSAGSETVFSLSQWRCYLDPTADLSQARQYLGTDAHPDVVDAREMARRVVARGYASTMSQVMMRRVARLDPAFPDTLTAREGQELLWSWTEAEPCWQARAYPPPGWVIWPASPGGRRGRGTLGPDLVNAREMARRVVLGGYAPSLGAHQIWKLARTDPNFPASWPTGGDRTAVVMVSGRTLLLAAPTANHGKPALCAADRTRPWRCTRQAGGETDPGRHRRPATGDRPAPRRRPGPPGGRCRA